MQIWYKSTAPTVQCTTHIPLQDEWIFDTNRLPLLYSTTHIPLQEKFIFYTNRLPLLYNPHSLTGEMYSLYKSTAPTVQPTFFYRRNVYFLCCILHTFLSQEMAFHTQLTTRKRGIKDKMRKNGFSSESEKYFNTIFISNGTGVNLWP